MDRIELRAYNAKGQPLLWVADLDSSNVRDFETVGAAFDVMESVRSAYRWDGEAQRFVRNRIASFRLDGEHWTREAVAEYTQERAARKAAKAAQEAPQEEAQQQEAAGAQQEAQGAAQGAVSVPAEVWSGPLGGITYRDRDGRVERCEFVGAVLGEREQNLYHDSYFHAVVWDEERQEVRSVEYGATAYLSNTTVTVDASREVIGKAVAHRAAGYLAEWEADHGKRVLRGMTAHVTVGGETLTGTVAWVGEARANGAWEARYGTRTARYGVKVEGRAKYVFRNADSPSLRVEVPGWTAEDREEMAERAEARARHDFREAIRAAEEREAQQAQQAAEAAQEAPAAPVLAAWELETLARAGEAPAVVRDVTADEEAAQEAQERPGGVLVAQETREGAEGVRAAVVARLDAVWSAGYVTGPGLALGERLIAAEVVADHCTDGGAREVFGQDRAALVAEYAAKSTYDLLNAYGRVRLATGGDVWALVGKNRGGERAEALRPVVERAMGAAGEVAVWWSSTATTAGGVERQGAAVIAAEVVAVFLAQELSGGSTVHRHARGALRVTRGNGTVIVLRPAGDRLA